ncbi:hypothetical protein AQUCO_01300674v1 [Aquilegia coerulea]|uniref:Ycf20-like protein n=1 Tax=Aquilegia coerulea TaxID=218851 RepID=A0A2G5E2X2_AQUCA|nr:hypothetical protein AQUCO_01300674v1 [Aquilegia coerulea]
MLMIVKMPVLPHYSKNAVVPFSKCLRSRVLVVACVHKTSIPCSRRLYPRLCFFHAALPSSVNCSQKTRLAWPARSSVDGGGFGSPGNSPNGRTRLIRAIQNFQGKLNLRIAELKKGLPMKIFFFLVGFYCATAFATVIGQTGDWDILSAGLAVVIVEGIGALMYKGSFPVFDKIKSLITMFNYWKAGLSMGLFLDAFKYEMDDVLGSCDLFRFEIDFFHIFL